MADASGVSTGGGQGGHGPQKSSWPLHWPPHFSRRVQNFEFRVQCLQKILANEKDVQGVNMILLGCYCALTYVALAFFLSFGFARKQQPVGNF